MSPASILDFDFVSAAMPPRLFVEPNQNPGELGDDTVLLEILTELLLLLAVFSEQTEPSHLFLPKDVVLFL